MRRRQHRSSSYYSGRRPYYSSQSSPSQISPLSARLPTCMILSTFLLGWLLGQHEGTRGMGVNFTLQSKEFLLSLTNGVFIFVGLAKQRECESPDGQQNNVAFCSVPQLLGKLMRERTMLERRMMTTKEYGSYYRQVFNDMSTKPSSTFPTTDEKRLRAIKRQKQQTPLFVTSPQSANKLSRRILIKHLTAVLREKSMSASSQPPTFTWITAGDATAAAHGNLYSQSYTAILQDTAESAFRALGIRFQAKNYGMGQYSSGPELGICMNEVFGDDIDVLMWDFASLQPGWEPPRRSILWSNRAGLHPTRPVLLSLDSYGDRFVNMDVGGTGTILMDANALQNLRAAMPDSNVVLHLPDSLRNFRCGDTFEGGVKCNDNMRNFVCYLDDVHDGVLDGDADSSAAEKAKVCRGNKFRTKPDCVDARYQMSWHPGWKDHMLKGRLIGHFLINSLEEALFELDQLKAQHGDDPKTLLTYLQQLDNRDKRKFRQTPPDTKVWDEDGVVFSRMDSAMVLQGETICHTALLPSRSRLEGITTENESGRFDKGVNQFLMSTPEDGLLPVAFDMNDRQICQQLEVDHKDFFLVREQDGWVSAVVPNDKELEVYRRSTPSKGIIVLCLKICPLNKCPDAYININEVSRRSKLFITVDGKAVTKVQKLDSCHILQGDDGIRWGNNDQFKLRFRIFDPGTLHVLKISSMIVF